MRMPRKPAPRPRKRPVRAARSSASNRSARAGAARDSRLGRSPRPNQQRRVPKSTIRPTPSGRPLTKRELDEFRRLLEVERDRLADEIRAIEEHLPEVEQISVDASGYDENLADVASETFEREKGIAIENSVQDLLQQVEEALERIEEGTYGVCQACGQPIHLDRLHALPYARLCIHCKAREEQAIPR